MKKCLSILCMASFLFALGCGDDDTSKNDNNENQSTDNDSSKTDTDSGNSGSDSGNSGSASEDALTLNESNLQTVPSSQDNTEGAECDSDTFVESCVGDSVVYCYYGEVVKLDCASENYQCITTLETYNGSSYNFANCYQSCTTVGQSQTVCGYGDDYADTLDTYVCAKSSVGNVWNITDSQYCGTACSNASCSVNQACGSVDEDGTCQSGNAVYCSYNTDESAEVLHIEVCENGCTDGYCD